MVDTSNYEKEAKQSEGQAKETASSDDASKTQANTEKENVSSEQTNEKEKYTDRTAEHAATNRLLNIPLITGIFSLARTFFMLTINDFPGRNENPFWISGCDLVVLIIST